MATLLPCCRRSILSLSIPFGIYLAIVQYLQEVEKDGLSIPFGIYRERAKVLKMSTNTKTLNPFWDLSGYSQTDL